MGYRALIGCSIVLLAALPTSSAEPVDFARDVYPILQRHCFECHGPEEQNGKVNFAALLPSA